MFQIKLSEDFQTLTIKLEEGQQLDEDTTEDDVFEWLTDNTCLTLIPEGTISGDITSAPCLAILSEDEPGEGGNFTNAIDVGCWPDREGEPSRPQRQRVIARWGFMRYAIASVADDLRDYGVAAFEGGLVWATPGDLMVDNAEFRQAVFDGLLDRRLDYYRDKVSELVEDPSCDPEKLRKATARLLVRLNALEAKRNRMKVLLLGP
jgi:hypothetical protein